MSSKTSGRVSSSWHGVGASEHSSRTNVPARKVGSSLPLRHSFAGIPVRNPRLCPSVLVLIHIHNLHGFWSNKYFLDEWDSIYMYVQSQKGITNYIPPMNQEGILVGGTKVPVAR